MVKLQSPGCTVASAAADETLRFWNVFGAPETPKPCSQSFPHWDVQQLQPYPIG